MKFVSNMWQNLEAGRTFDAVLVVTSSAFQRDRLRDYLDRRGGWNARFGHPPVRVASLDELGRPWRGGNFDASIFAIQRIRRLLAERGVPEDQAKSLVVLAAGHGTRAYPLTVAEGGNKSMIETPAQLGRRSLRMIELVLAQYHQILDEVEEGRIHVAAGDHLLAWGRSPRATGGQHVQIFASTVSFAEEAKAAGLLDGDLCPLYEDGLDLRRRLSSLHVPNALPVLHSLTQMGLLMASRGEEDLQYLVEKANVASIVEAFAPCGAKARVNWWDWSLSPDAARLLATFYAPLMGTGIDLSIDVLEPVTIHREAWYRRHPGRDPELWDRANLLFENPALANARPLGAIGVADPGEASIFADLGTLKAMHEAYSAALETTPVGEAYRGLLGARLEDGALFVGERPHPRVDVEPGSIVINGGGIRSGRIGKGSVVIDARANEMRTFGRCIVYRVSGGSRPLEVRDGEVAAGVVHRGRKHTVRGSLFHLPKDERDPRTWSRPQHGNPMSFSELHEEIVRLESGAWRRARRRRPAPSWEPRRRVSWSAPHELGPSGSQFARPPLSADPVSRLSSSSSSPSEPPPGQR